MVGMDQFIDFFGKITIAQVVGLVLALIFARYVYKEVKKYFINKYEAEKEKDEQLKRALQEVEKYPTYKKQSIDMQNHFQQEIDALKECQKEINENLKIMQANLDNRDKNRLRDRLLENYRYYTNKDRNPTQSWTKMESEAFWALFSDYEKVGGDGYMHTIVQPAMNMLNIIDM